MQIWFSMVRYWSMTCITARFQLKRHVQMYCHRISKGTDMTLRRSRLNIVLSVLSTVRDGAEKPTRIMYATNLSWKPTKRILASLVEQGLLLEFVSTESKRSRKRYGITEKGLSVIDYFKKAQGLFEIDVVLALD